MVFHDRAAKLGIDDTHLQAIDSAHQMRQIGNGISRIAAPVVRDDQKTPSAKHGARPLKEGVWNTVHYIDGEPDQAMIRMFGSHELPTPWTEETERETVVQELAARNANSKIS